MATLAEGYQAKGGLRKLLAISSRPSGAMRDSKQQTIYVPAGGPKTMSYEMGKARCSRATSSVK